jgi:hypothetical protein
VVGIADLVSSRAERPPGLVAVACEDAVCSARGAEQPTVLQTIIRRGQLTTSDWGRRNGLVEKCPRLSRVYPSWGVAC